MKGRLCAQNRVLITGLVALIAVGCGRERAATGDPHASLDCRDCHVANPAAGATGAAGAAGAAGALAVASPTACAGCHEAAELPDRVQLGGVRLPHAPHTAITADLSLACGACHVHASGAEPLGVGSGVCFGCHVSGQDTTLTVGAHGVRTPCLTCHTPTHTALTSSRTPINHRLIVDQGIACTQCHYDVTRGSGAVLRTECAACHAGTPPSLTAVPAAARADSVHRVHLGPMIGMACTRCHEPIRHEVVALASTVALNCLTCHREPHGVVLGREPEWAAACVGCHSEAHRAIQTIYTGLAAGDRVFPAKMFVARVACDACHSEVALAAPSSELQIAAINEACVACHGATYGRMLPRWTRSMARRTAAVSRYLADAVARAPLREAGATDTLIASASGDLGLVLTGRGVHNIPAADALLRSALTRAVDAYRAAGLEVPEPPHLGPNPATLSCGHCHYGVEAARDTIFGSVFDHAEHLLQAEIACSACHSEADYFVRGTRGLDPEHGLTTLTASSCSDCHHVDSRLDCIRCHEPATVATRARPITLRLEIGAAEAPVSREVIFEHSDHGEVGCTECHTARTDPSRVASCSSCHSEHHGDVAECTTCHGGETLAAHTVEHHFACADCHDRETLEQLTIGRAFCLSCHTDQATHRVGRECTPCHMQVSPAEVKSRILGR